MDETAIGFAALVDSLTENARGYRSAIPEAWRQGRTAYGGLMAGLSLTAVKRQFTDLPPFRSVTVNFIGPVTDSPDFSARLLRRGRNVTSVESVAKVGDDVVATFTFIFGALRPSAVTVDCPAPEAPLPDTCALFTPVQARSFVPQFFNRFDTRLIAGARPISGAKDGYIRAWSRHMDAASRDGIESLLTLGDVLPPAAMPMLTQLGPVSSANWIFTILTDTPTTEDGWWHVETKLTVANGGYSSQVMRIWNTDGELVAEGMQCVTIFA